MLRALDFPRSRTTVPALALLALCLSSGGQPAFAGNGTNGLPTPVTWPHCARYIKTVDRSVAPIFHLESSFVGDDDLREDNEPADSRTHQLFAMCRQRLRSESMPTWVAQQDYDTALAAFGSVVVGPVTPTDILDTNPHWQGCAHRVNPDDQRHVITLHQSLLGFDWDTRNVPEGTYVIEGYTLEPPHNAWSLQPHPGVVRVVDRRDPMSNPPAAVVTNRGGSYYRGEEINLEACVAGMPGTVIDLAWAIAPEVPPDPNANGRQTPEPLWHPIATSLAHDPRAVVRHTFAPPPEAIAATSTKILFRVTARDPQGRVHEAYSREEIDVLGIDKPLPCAEDPGLGEGTGEEAAEGDDEARCQSIGNTSSGAPWLAMFMGLGLLRRRRNARL